MPPKKNLQSSDIPEFVDQNILRSSIEELSSFDDQQIGHLVTSQILPASVVVRPFDPKAKPDLSSEKWICFPFYPFSIGFTIHSHPLLKSFFYHH
ncbi:hypothetical protein Hanom_Chr16g01476581 [Helianthus anomalus]